MKTAWDPHAAFGSLMALVSLLILLAGLAARLPRRFLIFTSALFVFMIIQLVLPSFNDSASTRWISALHAVNALIVTGLAIMLAIRGWPYVPFVSAPGREENAPSAIGDTVG